MILNIFPNVRVLKVKWNIGPPEQYEGLKYFCKPIQITNLKPKLRVLHDSVFCELASQMLASNLDGRFEELQLDLQDIKGISTHTVLGQLKNLPVLTTLTLQNLDMEINDLESMHANLPTIQTFSLTMNIADSEMPTKVIPATSITTFNIQIDRAPSVDMHIQFYQYMLKKYI